MHNNDAKLNKMNLCPEGYLKYIYTDEKYMDALFCFSLHLKWFLHAFVATYAPSKFARKGYFGFDHRERERKKTIGSSF